MICCNLVTISCSHMRSLSLVLALCLSFMFHVSAQSRQQIKYEWNCSSSSLCIFTVLCSHQAKPLAVLAADGIRSVCYRQRRDDNPKNEDLLSKPKCLHKCILQFMGEKFAQIADDDGRPDKRVCSPSNESGVRAREGSSRIGEGETVKRTKRKRFHLILMTRPSTNLYQEIFVFVLILLEKPIIKPIAHRRRRRRRRRDALVLLRFHARHNKQANERMNEKKR